MSDLPADFAARERFRKEWDRNFAVSANAGSGKTTAISERLASIALAPDGAEILRKTAVVTYTRKAAAQIGQRARQVLLKHLAREPGGSLAALDHLERAFFGTIHSFCLKLAQTYGQTAGINLNPQLVAENDDALWEEFLEGDAMQFVSLPEPSLNAFLRHVPLEEVFALARGLDTASARALRERRPGPPARPAGAALEQILALARKGSGAENIARSQQRAQAWQTAWDEGAGFLPLYEPAGTGKALVALAQEWMAPLKRWLADAAAVLAAELAGRYRAWRFERGVQTYADQIDAALAVLRDDALLDRIRREGWRIVLDEAQDTDPQQFAVLVEIARPPGAERGTWPGAGGGVAPGPRPGHFCLVGDGQQAIYGSRADIGNFTRHVEAFRRGDGGERLEFQVTFRTPEAVVERLNETLPATFGREPQHNYGLPPGEGAPAPFLQVPYVPLLPGPANVRGALARLPLSLPSDAPDGVAGWMEEEARQIAQRLVLHGPAGVGARAWGEVAVLAPRNDWLLSARKAFEGAGLKVALQTRRSRNGDHPVHAWLAGLLAVCHDPEDTFEWIGVLREVFGLSDGLLASELRRQARLAWEDPTLHAEPLAAALAALRPLILQVNDEGRALADFADALIAATQLEARVEVLDPSGGLRADLDRLRAEAAELGLEGGGPRAWRDELLARLEDGRAAGKPSDDAINLLTSHSAKGLEWPVVIVLGVWRGIGKAAERGLRLVSGPGAGGPPQVYFDGASLPAETRESRDRERVRELARLLYVTLTRPRRGLIVPWLEGFGGRQREKPSFAELWHAPLADWPALPDGPLAVEIPPGPATAVAERDTANAEPVRIEDRGVVARRILPHQLQHQAVDGVRTARHEAEPEAFPLVLSDDAIDYGLWWHETLEFVPWGASPAEIAAHGERALEAAAVAGFRARAEEEWTRLLRSGPWKELGDARWVRSAELAVLAPWREDGWIDGVIDLVLHDPVAKEVWVVDWKTNRRRSGESDDVLLKRLVATYEAQLDAYGRALRGFFPDASVRRLVYSSAAGAWIDVGQPG
ncbi:MAG TPA: UvrD-helicase domain-containing protein [Opitutaceae bacterium]